MNKRNHKLDKSKTIGAGRASTTASKKGARRGFSRALRGVVRPFVRKALAVSVSACLVWASFPLPRAAAAVNQTIVYQGRLGDASGRPVSGDHSFRFKFFDALTSGTELFTETWEGGNAVAVTNGVYEVRIGELIGGIPASVFDGDTVYLQIEVQLGTSLSAPETLSPRERIAGTAYAIHALTADQVADGAITSAKLASSAVTSAKVADGAITTAKIADASVTTAKLGAGDCTDGQILKLSGSEWGCAADAGGGGTLDQAYNDGGAGAGRTITVNASAVRLTGSNAADETLEVTNSADGGVLFVENTGTGYSLRVDDESGDTTPFVIDDAGNVGIGRTDADALLDLRHFNYPRIDLEWTDTGGRGEFYFYQGSTFYGSFGAFGSTYGGYASNALGFTSGVNNIGSIFFVTKTGGSYEERMLIKNDGSVGIGTMSPGDKLDVQNAGAVSIAVLNTSDATTSKLGATTTGGYVGTTSNHNFSIYANNSEKITVEPGGNVGIGTTNPGAKLEVAGTIRSAILNCTQALETNAAGDIICGTDANSGGTVTGVTASAPLASSGGAAPNISLTGAVADANVSDTLTIGNASTIALNTAVNNTEGGLSWDAANNRLRGGTGAAMASFYSGAHTVDVNTNAVTICANGQFLNGDGTCDAGFLDADGVDDDTPDSDAEVPDSISINNTRLYAPAGAGNVGIGTTSPVAKLDVGGTGAIKVPVGTTAQRPASPATGMMRFNSETASMELYNGTGWGYISLNFPCFATGGTITNVGGYRIHTFTSNGTFSTSNSCKVEVLVVGGGGGGGGTGGGGGGGGLIYHSDYSVAGNVSVTIGVGGSSVGYPGNGSNGGNSSFGSLIAVGGGYGSHASNGSSGGSGGGGGYSASSGGTGTQPSQGGDSGTFGFGTSGGKGYNASPGFPGGGGGGAGAAGANAPNATTAANGGDGKQYSISGTPTYYGGGGGGGTRSGTHGSGGQGGGGSGSTGGAANTGGGGSGGSSVGTVGGTSGGSGIVVARYRL